MRISEMSPDHKPTNHESQSQTLEEIETLIKQSETLTPINPTLPKISANLQTTLARLTSLSPLSKQSKLQIWKLSYRLWNACVDLSNSIEIKPTSSSTSIDEAKGRTQIGEEQAKLRQVSADLLFLAGDVEGIPSPCIKAASFFYKTGLIWHDLGKFELAANCYERAMGLSSKIEVDQVSDIGEQRLLLDLNIARARTAWEISERNVAITLLNRSKNLLFTSAESYTLLANQYLTFGKLVLSKNEASMIGESLKLMNECLDLCEKGLLRIARMPNHQLGLKTVKSKCLRFMAAAHLQGEEYESVLKCIKVLREEVGGGDNHPCLPVLAMKAWLGLKRYKEAEKELRGMVVNKGIPEAIWVSAVESYFQEVGVAGAETAKGLFLGLLGRCHVSAGAAVRVAQKVAGGGGGEGSRVRAKVAAELVSDERVVALFDENAVANERTAMHAVLWNCGADHFRVKDYETGAEMFEKSMLYVPHNVENKILRAKCFRVLCLCYLGLSQLDQAQEYINEADKLHPNIACAFLKFKIYLQKNNIDGAINQMQSMSSCLDFTPDFFILSAHEAIASQALPVTIASLSNLLNFYSPRKSMPTPQVVVLRTLITVLSRDPGNEDQVLKFTKLARTRMFDLGTEEFFGKGEVGRREQNWFSVNSWNIGTRIGREKKYDICAELLELASDFYGVTEDNQVMVCKSLILSVSAMIAVEKQRNIPLQDSEVKHAIEMLDKAGKILATISYGTKLADDPTTVEPNFFFVYIFNSYDLRGRQSDSNEHQLHLIKNLASSKICTPQYLLHMGLTALKGPRPNMEVADYALNTSLSTLLSSPSPNYKTIAIILRKLIGFVGFKKGDGDDEVYSVYKQAYQIMVGLKAGEYPSEEGKWLAMTAWNRAAMPVRLGQIGIARRWMKIGLDMSQHVSDMGAFKDCMEEFLAGFEKKFEAHDDGCT
ncbi:hypothetical protein GIB67_032820 [Kingdonia uniflora]|uniref:Protein ZIP4 homolog n=1 Tax=Kingdonia uniflora TaxID=39325 RepID=A0A7J7NC89_9MAGN|nr:hypothetical protein GIB67_032820 [Kingdonia uniflora]